MYVFHVLFFMSFTIGYINANAIIADGSITFHKHCFINVAIISVFVPCIGTFK